MAEILPHPVLAEMNDPVRQFVHLLDAAVGRLNDFQRQDPSETTEVLIVLYSWAASELRAIKAQDDPVIEVVLRLVQSLPDDARKDAAS